ncbi:NHR domain-containing protein [Aphelenchoides bicaudatus]|nr:NHR domain-containing protein [Aphelenchoides bicaudatus]
MEASTSTSTSSWCYDPDDETQQFHAFHGSNIKLSNDRRLAERQGSFRGLCFSAKPLKPLFPFVINIVEEEAGWTGHLRIGLTLVDPATLPNLDSNDFIQQTILAPIPKSIQSVNTPSTDIKSAICIYFKCVSPGFIQPFVIINNEHICLQTTSAIPMRENSQIFAVADLFGVCKSIQVLPVKLSVLRLSAICEKRIRRALINAQSAEALPLPKIIRQNIMRSSIGTVAVV